MSGLLYKVSIILFFTSLSCISESKLILKELVAPPQAPRNEDVFLFCNYDLQNQTLESVAWFFNSSEIYRYTQKQRNKQHFPSPAVEVDLPRSNETILALKNIRLESTGYYKCSVNTDHPHLETKEKVALMEVVVIPKEKPHLDGVPTDGFKHGTVAQINCTSAPSKPASNLAFQVNGKTIHKNHTIEYPIVETDDGLYITKSALLLKHKTHLFTNDELDLTCISRIQTKEKLAVLAVIKSAGTVILQSVGILMSCLVVSLSR